MSGDTLLVFLILGVTIALFISDRLRLDLVALLSLLSLLVTGILTPAEGLAGFSDTAVITIAALFVVGSAMLHTGLAERFGRAIGRLAGTGRARLTAVLMLGTAMISAFVSTTGTVALMLPVAAALARNARLSPSVLLMPMSVAALLGGILTLIATPPNIIVAQQLAAAGFEPFHFFSFTPIGITMLAIGLAVLVPLAGRLLPARAPVDAPAGAGGVARISGEELARGYEIGEIARVRVPATSPLVGETVAGLGLRKRYGVNILSVRRCARPGGRRERRPRTAEEVIEADDELEMSGGADAVARLCDETRARPRRIPEHLGRGPRRGRPPAPLEADRQDADRREVPHPLPRERPLAPPRRTTVRGRHRDGTARVRRHPPRRRAPDRIEELRSESMDFVVVAQTTPFISEGRLSRREATTLAILVAMVGLLAFDVLPAVVAVLLAAVALALTRCVDMETAYRTMNWQSLILIGSMLPMATALQKTGGVDVVIALLSPVFSAGPIQLLAGIFILTAVLGQFISNTATAVLVAPVAIGAAAQLGVSPYPIMMTVAIAASTSFATPVATPVNLLVIGPGQYKAADFARVGLLVQALVLVATLVVVPMWFPF